jgi:hypothetical protein
MRIRERSLALMLLFFGCEGGRIPGGGRQVGPPQTAEAGVDANAAEDGGPLANDDADLTDRGGPGTDGGAADRDEPAPDAVAVNDAAAPDAFVPVDVGFPADAVSFDAATGVCAELGACCVGLPEPLLSSCMSTANGGVVADCQTRLNNYRTLGLCGGLDGGAPADTGIPPDTGVRPDTGVVADAGPALQTQISVVPGTAVAQLGTDFDFSATLSYANSGPGAQTISVVHAEVQVLIPVAMTMQVFAVSPAHTAPVGNSQRGVAKVPGSGDRIIDPQLVLLFCQFPLGIPVSVLLEFSNGAAILEDVAVTCVP